MIFFQLLLVAIIALVLTFFLGYTILRSFTNLTEKECICLAGACGMALQSGVAFIGFVFGISGRIFLLLVTLVLLAMAIRFLKKKKTKPVILKKYSWLYLFCVVWIILVGIQLFVPIYSGAFFFGDWWMHYDIGKVYVGLQNTDTIYFNRYSVTARTPLFNLFASYYFGLLGEQFSTYQFICILPGVFLLTTIALFIRPKRVIMAIILIALNGYINNMTIYPWPKILATLYVMTGFYFYIKLRKNHSSSNFCSQASVGCGLSWGLAVLTHPSTVLYVGAIIADNIWINRLSFIKILRQLFIPLIIAFGVLLPWLLWGMYEYGIQEFFASLSSTTGNYTLREKLIDIINNGIYTLIPFPLFNSLIKINIATPIIGQVGNFWLRFYYDVLPGVLTITLSFLLLWGGVRQYLQKKPIQSIFPDFLFFTTIIIGFWGACILQPGFGISRAGIAGESMTPLVFILLLVASDYFCSLPVKLRPIVLLMVAGEFFISRGFHLILMAIKHSFIWDDNLQLKVKNNLVFASDLMVNHLPAFILIIFGFMLLLMIGLKTSVSRKI